MLWKNWIAEYYVANELVEIKDYGVKNIFFSPFRKIYRPKKYAGKNFEFDIFVLEKFSRLNKKMKYYLATLDDEKELTDKLKEQSNEEISRQERS